MKKAFALLALVASVVILAGCAAGEKVVIPITMPDKETATIVAHQQHVPDWMMGVDGLKMNYIVQGNVTDKQLAAVAESERACRIYAKTTQPNALVMVLVHGVLYAAAGATGLAIGSHYLAKTIDEGAYAKYGAAASGASGAANGLVSSGTPVYSFHNCNRDVMATFAKYGVRPMR